MIKRNSLNLLIDIVTFLVMFAVAMTGLLLRFALPPGSRGGAGRTLWNWDRHDIGDLHFYLVLTLLGVLIVHLALHWNWVCVTVRRWFGRGEQAARPSAWLRPAWGVLTLTAIVAAGAVFYVLAIKNVEVGVRARHERAGVSAQRSTSWMEVAPRRNRGLPPAARTPAAE